MFRRPLSRSWLFLSLFLLPALSFTLHASPVPKPPIVVSVVEAFDYSARDARVPLRVRLENTTSSDKTATLQFREGWQREKGSTCTYPSSFLPGKASRQSFTRPSPATFSMR